MRTSLLTRIMFCLLFTSCSQWKLEPKTTKLYKAPEMVMVEGGTFQMGGVDGYTNEQPTHMVTVSDFLISKNEVTIEQYLEFCNATNYRIPFKPEYPANGDWVSNGPVVNVSWDDAQAYCAWLTQQTGKHFRLPTEAEWEYAAKGGKSIQTFKFAGSNTPDDVAWWGGNPDTDKRITPGIRPIGQKQPNQLGLYDMSGNVWEWCSDWFGAYPPSAVTNPTGPTTGTNRVLRGGSWWDMENLVRIKARYSFAQNFTYWALGIRLVQDV